MDNQHACKNIFTTDEMEHKEVLKTKQQYARSAFHVGQMASKYPLSESQRETMNHYTQSNSGEIFAVNGPPGTGKTTFLHTAIAHEYVKAALGQKEPPVILAVSNNNQAVTNIIDSFGDVFSKDELLGQRWLPGVSSFGSYFVSSSNAKAHQRYQCLSINTKFLTGFFEKLQSEDYLANGRREFLDRAGKYMNRSNYTQLDEAINDLHKLIKQKVQEIDYVINNVMECQDAINEIEKQYEVDINIIYRKKISEKELYISSFNQWSELLSEFYEWLKGQTFIKRLLMRWPILKGVFIRDFDRFIDDHPILFDRVERSFKSIEHYILEQKSQAKRLDNKTELELTSIKKHMEEIKAYETRLIQLCEKYSAEYSGNGEVAKSINNALDTTLRYEAFRLATHYYEGRWLQETKNIDNNSKENRLRQLKRLAKITPCFVSTFYMVPKLLEISSNNKPYKPGYSYEGIDLLIVDEAGQASPEVSLPLFALAKKAIMVGDTYQIEPVWSVEEITDAPNIDRYVTHIGADTFKEIGYASSNGNLMKIAKRRSRYEKYGEGGLYLTEHRRCIPEVIQYCNELAYNGKLKPMRPNELKNYPFKHMSHLHISGNAEVVNGSRKNTIEANAIVNWIVNNTNVLLKYYNTSKDEQYKSIQDIVAVITPFKSQKNQIKALLRKHIGFEGITVGTVHALQGAERHVIIFSTVYTHKDQKNYFFDRGVNMLNVAVSRAKDSFMVIGDEALFKNQSGDTVPSKILAKYIGVDE